MFDLYIVPPGTGREVVAAYLGDSESLKTKALWNIDGRGIAARRKLVRSILGRLEFVEPNADAPLPSAAGALPL